MRIDPFPRFFGETDIFYIRYGRTLQKTKLRVEWRKRFTAGEESGGAV